MTVDRPIRDGLHHPGAEDRHAHGVLPSEYDIREVPEDLYLEVLEQRRRLGAAD